ncbi:gas vesicle protein GvpD [Providencia rettgeri]|uniref:gas vesicle protein GvpD n=1 Tax=Providencia TaxID=586 RepID=UPI001CFD3EC7|nr:gas vesicle protein GvpD [Providencia rettgeri]EIU7557588.1 hypothetical protein [Providencia rettgeri]MCB4841437.1 hypothetical protein [Providencia rettgeri]MCG5377624.1 DnaB helicase C-terminal domain-containing protein [Providencia rettgeri]
MDFNYINKKSLVSLDDIINEFQGKSLITITGLPSSGKTRLALRITEMVSRDNSVLYVTLSETKEQLIKCFTSMITGVSYKDINKELSKEKIDDIKKTLGNYSNNKILIADNSDLTLEQLDKLCTDTKLKNKDLKLIVIDKHGSLNVNEFNSFSERTTAILDKLNNISCNLNVPIVMIYNTRRSVHSVPNDDDLHILIQRSDIVINTVNLDGNFEISVDKNNLGATGIIK